MRTESGWGRCLVSKNDSCTSLGPRASPEQRYKVECNGVRLQSEHYYASYCFTSLTCAQVIGGSQLRKCLQVGCGQCFVTATQNQSKASSVARSEEETGESPLKLEGQLPWSMQSSSSMRDPSHQGGRREVTPQSCPLSSTHTSWHVGPHL